MSTQGDLIQMGIYPDLDGSIRIPGTLYARNVVALVDTVWYVDGRRSVSGNGKSWTRAFVTIAEALTAIAAAYAASTSNTFNTIYVAAGDYDVSAAALALTVEGTKIIGSGDAYRNVSMIYSASGSLDLMTINAHHCEIIGMAFSVIPDTKSAIVVSGSSASYKCRAAHCRFDGWSGEYGIYLNESPDFVIEHNLFRSCNTAGVRSNSTRTIIRDNIFHVVTDKTGIDHIPSGGNRPDNVYVDNYFSAIANSSTTAIKFTGAPNNGTIIVANNRFAGTYDTNPTTKIAAYGGVENYQGDDAGGARTDTVT